MTAEERIKEQIDEAIKQIAEQAPKLAAHLKENIRMENGKFVYLDTNMKWNLEALEEK